MPIYTNNNHWIFEKSGILSLLRFRIHIHIVVASSKWKLTRVTNFLSILLQSFFFKLPEICFFLRLNKINIEIWEKIKSIPSWNFIFELFLCFLLYLLLLFHCENSSMFFITKNIYLGSDPFLVMKLHNSTWFLKSLNELESKGNKIFFLFALRKFFCLFFIFVSISLDLLIFHAMIEFILHHQIILFQRALSLSRRVFIFLNEMYSNNFFIRLFQIYTSMMT